MKVRWFPPYLKQHTVIHSVKQRYVLWSYICTWPHLWIVNTFGTSKDSKRKRLSHPVASSPGRPSRDCLMSWTRIKQVFIFYLYDNVHFFKTMQLADCQSNSKQTFIICLCACICNGSNNLDRSKSEKLLWKEIEQQIEVIVSLCSILHCLSTRLSSCARFSLSSFSIMSLWWGMCPNVICICVNSLCHKFTMSQYLMN
jgi:hypothetical protein